MRPKYICLLLTVIAAQITPSSAEVREWDASGKSIRSEKTSEAFVAKGNDQGLSKNATPQASTDVQNVGDHQVNNHSIRIIKRDTASTPITWSRQVITKQSIIAARRYGLPEELFLALIKQESAFKIEALSKAGAFGLAQLMPATARYLGVDRHDPAQNLDGGARYLREQYKRFGKWPLALAAYNAGPEAVAKYGGIPPYRETQNYVRMIMADVDNPLQAPTAKSVPSSVATTHARVLSRPNPNVLEF